MGGERKSPIITGFTQKKGRAAKITWEIPNYFSLPEDKEFSLDSKEFGLWSSKWLLRFYPYKRRGDRFALVRSTTFALEPRQTIIVKIDVITEEGKCLYDKVGYQRLGFEKISFERIYNIADYSCKVEKIPDLRNFLREGTLTLLVQLLPEEVPAEDELSLRTNYFNPNEKLYNAQQNNNIRINAYIVQSLKISWNVPDYPSLPKTVGYALESSPLDFGGAFWLLRVFLNGTTKNPTKTVMTLVKMHPLNWDYNVVTRFTFVSSCGTWTQYRATHFTNSLEFMCDGRSDMPPGPSELSFHFITDSPLEKCEASEQLSGGKKNYTELIEDLQKVNGEKCDFVLKVKGKEFPVHRRILGIRSEIFESMLEQDVQKDNVEVHATEKDNSTVHKTERINGSAHVKEENGGIQVTEKDSSFVDVHDCDPQIMEQLFYAYCGKVYSLDETNMIELYCAADKYKMISLKDVCYNFIRNALSCDNFCQIFDFAVKKNCKDVLENATEFFIQNINEILPTPEWMSVLGSNTIIANELLIKAAKNVTEKNKMLKLNNKGL